MRRVVDVDSLAKLRREVARAIRLPPAPAADDLTLCVLDPLLGGRDP